MVTPSWCSCHLAIPCLQRWRSEGCAFCHSVLMHMQELSATWLPTTYASLLSLLHALSRWTLSVPFAGWSLLPIWDLNRTLQKKGSPWCCCICCCYTQTQPLVANLPSHPAGNWYSFKDTVLKFNSVIWSAHQSEGERRCCINNDLSGERKMPSNNML